MTFVFDQAKLKIYENFNTQCSQQLILFHPKIINC
uniref:Glycerol-3-phosphate acyltransferase 3-like n=1 Tax=Rhizophora mucronata TaxID=61149 RepID=A0A2P2N3H9_RHIMU